MIIQGSNEPIYLAFIDEETMEDITDFSAKLYVDGVMQKEWDMSNSEIKDNVITLGLTQEETMQFELGFATLEAKWLNPDGMTVFAELATIKIARRDDRKILGGV